MAEGGDVAAAALSSTTIEKAVRELNEPEDPEKKLAAIKELRLKLEEWQQTEGTEAEFTLTRVERWQVSIEIFAYQEVWRGESVHTVCELSQVSP